MMFSHSNKPMCRAVRTPLLLCAVMAVIGEADVARAQSLSFRSSTLGVGLGTQPQLDATDSRAQVLIYQLVDLSARDVGVQGVQVEMSGVLGAILGSEPIGDDGEPGDRFQGDVRVGLVRWESSERTFSASFGRQYLFAGGGRAEHLDGVSLTYRSPWWVDLTVFGGRTEPWQWDYDPEKPQAPLQKPEFFSTYAAGARARWRLLDIGVASVGFLHEGDGADTVRRLVTFDAGYWRSTWFDALAGGIVDTIAGSPQELWLELISRPHSRLKLSGGYTYLVPGLAIPKTSLFSVFSVDEYHDGSLQAHLGLHDRVMVGVEGGVRFFPDAPTDRVGYSLGSRARVVLDESAAGRTLGLNVEYNDAGQRRLVQGRLFVSYGFLENRIYCRADVYLLGLLADNSGGSASLFERAIEQTPLSFGGIGVLGWRFTTRWNALLASSAFSTPWARSDLRLMARLTYQAFWDWSR